MQLFMQEIYRKQNGLIPEKEHMVSFLGSGNDDAVLKELHRRCLSDERINALEGPISQEELTNQRQHHMKPISSPGFTVAWVRYCLCDLSYLCVAAVNTCYEQ